MSRYFIILIIVALSACDRQALEGSGQRRLELFRECMILAKDTVQVGHYNDSAEVIKECGKQSYYISNHMANEEK